MRAIFLVFLLVRFGDKRDGEGRTLNSRFSLVVTKQVRGNNNSFGCAQVFESKSIQSWGCTTLFVLSFGGFRVESLLFEGSSAGSENQNLTFT